MSVPDLTWPIPLLTSVSNLSTQCLNKTQASWTKLRSYDYADHILEALRLLVCIVSTCNTLILIFVVDFPPTLRKLVEGHFGYVDGGYQGRNPLRNDCKEIFGVGFSILSFFGFSDVSNVSYVRPPPIINQNYRHLNGC